MGLSRGPPADLLTRSLELERVSNDQPDDLLGDRDHRLLVSRLPRLGFRRRVQPLRLGGTRGGASGVASKPLARNERIEVPSAVALFPADPPLGCRASGPSVPTPTSGASPGCRGVDISPPWRSRSS
jgi:hypothetical protein